MRDERILSDFIDLSARGLPAIMGYARHEREEPQGIHVNVQLYFQAQTAARSGKLEDAIDYVRVLGEFRFLLWASRFFLIETAAETLCRYVLSPQVDGSPAQATAVNLRLEKPSALGSHATPALNLFRKRGDYDFRAFGSESLQLIDDNRDCRVSRIVLPPGGAFTATQERTALMTLDEDVFEDGEKLPRGGATYCVGNGGAEFVNRGLSSAVLLSVECRDAAWNRRHLEHYPASQSQGFSFYDAVLREYIQRD